MRNADSQLNKERFEGRRTSLKSAILSKTSKALSVMLILSLLLPVMALAATGFKDVTYKKGTVSGTVYSDVYDVNAQVYLYAPNGELLDRVKVQNPSTDVNGVTYYSFSTTVTGYTYLNLHGLITGNGTPVDDAVYQTVYRSDSSSSRRGGGGGGYFPGINGEIDASTGKVYADTLKNAFSSNSDVIIRFKGDKLELALAGLVGAPKDGKLTIIGENGTYILPVSVFNVDAIAEQLEAKADDVMIAVTIKKLTGSDAEAVQAAVAAIGGTQVADAVDFKVEATGNNKTIDINFGKTYVERELKLSQSVDPKKATGVLFNGSTLSFVPSTFETEDDNTYAILKRNGNSIYTVIEHSKSFSDIVGHWAQADVELLANKLVVDGVTDSTFEADRNITRAEFAALVVRSLGLTPGSGSASFSDVASGAWYADVVATAANAGIIDGYEDNTFRPNQQITREELAAMVVRALAYVGEDTSVTSNEQAQLLGKFKDASDIVWAQAEIAAAIRAGLMDGMTDTTLESSSSATRAQSATMLKRFLSSADFIN